MVLTLKKEEDLSSTSRSSTVQLLVPPESCVICLLLVKQKYSTNGIKQHDGFRSDIGKLCEPCKEVTDAKEMAPRKKKSLTVCRHK